MKAPRKYGYPGNKGSFGSFQNIINQFPLHQNFIGACAGSGEVEKRKLLAPGQNIVCELDADVIAEYWTDDSGYRIVENDFVKWYPKRRFIGTTLIYADPPYLLSSRSNGLRYYKHEWEDEKHEEFLTLATGSKDLWAISHYKCPLYDKYLKGWRLIQWQVMTHTGPRKEALYMNYSKPAQLHQYNYLGANFTDRQRLKRMKGNFIQKLKRLPDQERYMLLNAVQEYIEQNGLKNL